MGNNSRLNTGEQWTWRHSKRNYPKWNKEENKLENKMSMGSLHQWAMGQYQTA